MKIKNYYKNKWLLVICLLISTQAIAISDGNVNSILDPNVVKIDEAKFLGTPLDKDLILIDEKGNEFTLAEKMGKPLILLFSYYTCDGVCETLNQYLAQRLIELKESEPERDYQALTISFDKNDNIESLGTFINHRVGVPEDLKDHWKLSVMKNPEDIKRLTDSVGVRYFWSHRDKTFIHPNAFIFVTPKGRVARYLHGAEFTVKDLNLALIDADWEKISRAGRVIDILAGACFSYNYKEGKYTLSVPLVVGVASLLTGIFITIFAFRVKINKKKNEE
ncbi:MAG: SCO family protein [Gammaproteobacteria bacterium]|nr:SCO family protein [Gammaproteobacteria bacterium]